jgi:signal transduction histidine kinase
MDAVLDAGRAGTNRRGLDATPLRAAPRVAAIASVVSLAALTSEQADWQPLSLVLALGATMIVADVMAVAARHVRVSAGLMVQVVGMALLGPAPAVAMGIVAAIPDALINRIWRLGALNNMAIFGFLGLVGGLMFEVLGDAFGLDRRDTAYALLVPPVGLLLLALNLGLIATSDPGLPPPARRRILRESAVPTLPLELMNALMATATVLVWAHVGLAAVPALLLVLVITVPLMRAIGTALMNRDDLAALRHVFDERAAEVARLASDRDRLLSEVLEAEERERARLAESLHDGPVQRLVALRQDAAEGATSEMITGSVDAALAETRAIISAFHPVTVRELGFAASLRAAIAPFPAAQSINLTVDSALDDRFLAGTLLLPVAQELVVNAVKHANPSAINLVVRANNGEVTIEVNDDGVGIDSSDTSRAVQAGHVGLAMVRRRVEDSGGRFEIETRADGGTHSRIVLPMREAA